MVRPRGMLMSSSFHSPSPYAPLRCSTLPSAASASSSSCLSHLRFLPTNSLFPRRSRRRSHLRKPNIPIFRPQPSSQPSPSQRDIEISLDFDAVIDRASTSATKLYRTTKFRLRRYLSEGADAFRDLGSSVHVDGHRVIFSCRPSSLAFLWGALVWGFLAAVSVRAVLWAWGSVHEVRSWGLVRRDRSLGGREVVVARGLKGRRLEMPVQSPLSPTKVREPRNGKTAPSRRRSEEQNLPDWWPVGPVTPMVKMPFAVIEEYQRSANMLVRAMMNRRVSGKDYTEDDIIQLRRLCRFSGVRVSFDTANSRDSFYRASIDFVLNICSRASKVPKDIQIDGEDIHRFLAGLADNVELENKRAIVLLRGAIAAKTRLCFLQTWALEAQEKNLDAVTELSKVVNILKVFPLEEDSPEIEMVANGIKRNLTVVQREHLLSLFERVGGDKIQRIGKAALGLADESISDF